MYPPHTDPTEELQPIDPHLDRLMRAAEIIKARRRDEQKAARILLGFCSGAIEPSPVLYGWAKRILDRRNKEETAA